MDLKESLNITITNLRVSRENKSIASEELFRCSYIYQTEKSDKSEVDLIIASKNEIEANKIYEESLAKYNSAQLAYDTYILSK